jgi:hypothetical protein
MGMYINNLRNRIYNIFITVILKYKERFTGKEYWLVFQPKIHILLMFFRWGEEVRCFSGILGP